MTKSKAITLGVFTAWPLVAGPVIGLIALLVEMKGILKVKPSDELVLFSVFYSITPICVLALLVFYIGYLFAKSQLPLGKRLVWFAVLVFGHVLAMPLFWYLHIWKPPGVSPMRGFFKFSLFIFCPLLLLLIPPLLFLLFSSSFAMPFSVMYAFILDTDSIEWAESAAVILAWVVGPGFIAAGIFALGRWCYILFSRAGSRVAAWISLWSVFSVMSVPVFFYDMFLLICMCPSGDGHSLVGDLKFASIGAVVLALMAQPAVLIWMFAASSELRNFASKKE
jgi:hypothetical protein